MSGLILDEHCSRAGMVVEPFDCTLNMTDLKDNKNKFYIMQIIKESIGKNYTLFIRYGRIGEVGRISYETSANLDTCINRFTTQFKSKTKNSWEQRDNFVRYKDKYNLCDKQLPTSDNTKKDSGGSGDSGADAKADSEGDAKADSEEKADSGAGDDLGGDAKVVDSFKSKLDARVVDFLHLVGDITMLRQTLSSLNIDIKKMPLGAISIDQMNRADAVLDQIQAVIDGKQKNTDLTDLSSEFYTFVPVNSGRIKKPPIINHQQIIDECRQKLDELRNLKIAYSAIEVNQKNARHPADELYDRIATDIIPVDPNGVVWKEIEKYVYQTQGSTHRCKVKIIDIYQINRHPDQKVITLMGNKHLLWHGTRLSNYISILQNGLLLRPETLGTGVAITGKMFGYGIYGANSFSKSFNYTNCGHDEEACLFLGEFALGKTLELTDADYYLTKQNLKDRGGFHSTWGRGQYTPDNIIEMTLTEGKKPVKIPNGKLTRSNLPNCSLQYDEFIVYDEKQVVLKYIVRVKNL